MPALIDLKMPPKRSLNKGWKSEIIICLLVILWGSTVGESFFAGKQKKYPLGEQIVKMLSKELIIPDIQRQMRPQQEEEREPSTTAVVERRPSLDEDFFEEKTKNLRKATKKKHNQYQGEMNDVEEEEDEQVEVGTDVTKPLLKTLKPEDYFPGVMKEKRINKKSSKSRARLEDWDTAGERGKEVVKKYYTKKQVDYLTSSTGRPICKTTECCEEEAVLEAADDAGGGGGETVGGGGEGEAYEDYGVGPLYDDGEGEAGPCGSCPTEGTTSGCEIEGQEECSCRCRLRTTAASSCTCMANRVTKKTKPKAYLGTACPTRPRPCPIKADLDLWINRVDCLPTYIISENETTIVGEIPSINGAPILKYVIKKKLNINLNKKKKLTRQSTESNKNNEEDDEIEELVVTTRSKKIKAKSLHKTTRTTRTRKSIKQGNYPNEINYDDPFASFISPASNTDDDLEELFNQMRKFTLPVRSDKTNYIFQPKSGKITKKGKSDSDKTENAVETNTEESQGDSTTALNEKSYQKLSEEEFLNLLFKNKLEVDESDEATKLENVSNKIFETARLLRANIAMKQEGLKKVNEEERLLQTGMSNLRDILKECKTLKKGLENSKLKFATKLKSLHELSQLQNLAHAKISHRINELLQSINAEGPNKRVKNN